MRTSLAFLMSALPVDDPFTTPDTRRSGGLLSFGSRLDPSPRLDSSPNGLSLMTPPSPTQLKRALIARLEDVQKRLQGAGQLGESLVRQQRELEEKIKEVEAEAAKGGEISPELRQKLTVLEKEYNEVHKESTRALLSSKIHGSLDSPHKVCLISCKYSMSAFAQHWSALFPWDKSTISWVQFPDKAGCTFTPTTKPTCKIK